MSDRPTYTALVDEQYLIEALTSAGKTSSYLDNFPEEIFNTSLDSRLYKFLHTLIGPAGVSFLKTNYFYARLQLEEHGLNFDQLDKLYANPMRFARSYDESYLENWKGVLNKESWDLIKSLDEAYRQRATDYLHAARLGPTVEGMRLASKSALGFNTRIIENYQFIFNQHSDQILNYNLTLDSNKDGYYNTEEFTVIPNQPDINDAENLKEIDGEVKHLLRHAIDNLKPLNTFFNTNVGQADSHVLNIKSIDASSEFHQVLKFVTGNSNISWPNSNKYDSTYWIESGIEKESPRNHGDFQQHYLHFHKPSSVQASSHSIGNLNSNQKLINLFPNLKDLPKDTPWTGNKALANYETPLMVTRQNSSTNTSFINHDYPIEYLQLPNAPSINYNNQIWLSKNDTTNEKENLKITFDDCKAINFLIFETLLAPVSIEISHSTGNHIREISNSLYNPIISVSCNQSAGSTIYTYTLSNNPILNENDVVTISGITDAPFYNGNYIVESVNGNTFTVVGLASNQKPVSGLSVSNAKIIKNTFNTKPVNYNPLYPNETILHYNSASLNKMKTLSFNFDLIYTEFINISFTRKKFDQYDESWPIAVKNLRIGRNIV